MRAPKVTISPWAKFTRPVTPKMSESPTAAMPMMRPTRSPASNRVPAFSSNGVPAIRGPRGKTTVRRRPLTLRLLIVPFSSSRRSAPSGRVSGSRVTE
jgi:hypothetical protein